MPEHFNELVQNNGKLSKMQMFNLLYEWPIFVHACQLPNSVCFWEAPLCDGIWHCSTVSPHLSHACASVCVCTVMTRRSVRCCKHKPASLENQPAAQAEKHALCTQDKPLHHDTSAVVGNADCPLSRWGATAERPPGNPSVIVMAGRPMALYRLNKMKQGTERKIQCIIKY